MKNNKEMIVFYGDEKIIDQIGHELKWEHLDKINILSIKKKCGIEEIYRQLGESNGKFIKKN